MENPHAYEPNIGNGYGSASSHMLEQPFAIGGQHILNASCVGTVHELEDAFNAKLLVTDELDSHNHLTFDNDKKRIMVDENGRADSCSDVDNLVEACGKYFQKSASFPVTAGAEKTSNFELENKSLTHSSSLPTARKLVSAMKGGREKEGIPPKKLSVSWAPDVYDPPPTSVSHYPSKKKAQQQYKSKKKHGKGKHKGKTVRGGGSAPKDKKHNRSRNGSIPQQCLSVPTDNEISSHNCKPALGFPDFEHRTDDIGAPESSCGSSFRGKACGGTMHFAYAEAT